MAFSTEFTVWGRPVPQGSVSHFGGHVVAVSKDLHEWRDLVTAAAMESVGPDFKPLDAMMGIRVYFYFEPPARKKFARPGVAPDGDKLLRAIQDALTFVPAGKNPHPGLVVNDSRFVDGKYSKHYGANCAIIRVWEITE
jgi:Holliday junction resolvase RusA-like endonuclease